MTDTTYNVLFLCTGNSARSIFAEALMNYWGQGKFKAYSAGSHPTGQVNPMALVLLARLNIPTEGLCSKNWDEFSAPAAPKMDFVFTVCDNAANETCPVWPGQPLTAHWGVEDPAAVSGNDIEKMQAFRKAFRELENRIKIFASLPISDLNELQIQKEIEHIGRISSEQLSPENV